MSRTPSSTKRTPNRKRNRFNGTKYDIVAESPTLDTSTPIEKHINQGQGLYCPVTKAAEKPVYHNRPMNVVPLKKKRGRRKINRMDNIFTAPVDEFHFNTCGYNLGDPSTKHTFSNHKNHSISCDCEEFVDTITKKGLSWHSSGGRHRSLHTDINSFSIILFLI